MELKVKQLNLLLEQYVGLRQCYLDTYALLAEIRDCVREHKADYKITNNVDFLYVMRETSKIANDLRKECDGIIKIFENVTCALWVTQNEAGPIRGALATGSPDLKVGVNLPNQNREPEKFEALMNFFKIPNDAVKNKVVKLYWPGLCEHISNLIEEGKPLPPGIDPTKTYPTYSVRILMFKNLDELGRDLDAAGRKEVEEARNKLLTTR